MRSAEDRAEVDRLVRDYVNADRSDTFVSYNDAILLAREVVRLRRRVLALRRRIRTAL